MQMPLFKQLSLRTPLRYFGGKTLGTRSLIKYIPNVNEIVSPFFGSGALELALTARGVRVHGYDKFPPIVHFWQMLKAYPEDVANAIRKIVRNSTPDNIYKSAVFAYQESECDVQKAALILIIFNSSFNGMGFNSGSTNKLEINGDNLNYIIGTDKSIRTLIWYDRIDDFHNPFIEVSEADFRDSLDVHTDIFAYCDPPYPVDANCYGDSDEYHKDFPHDELAEILRNRGNWTLSYNNVELTRKLYPQDEFDWYRVSWKQGSRSKGTQEGNDVVITPRGQCDFGERFRHSCAL